MDNETKKTTVYLPKQMHEQLLKSARENKRSFNSEVLYALKQYLRKEENHDKKL